MFRTFRESPDSKFSENFGNIRTGVDPGSIRGFPKFSENFGNPRIDIIMTTTPKNHYIQERGRPAEASTEAKHDLLHSLTKTNTMRPIAFYRACAISKLEIVKSYEISLEEVEEWINELRIWFQRANLEEGSDSKRGKKRSLERESSKDTPAQKEVPETSETEVIVDEEVRKTKKKRKTAATDDPYTLLVPKPKKKPVNTEKSGSSSKAVVLEEKPSSCTRTKTAVSSKAQNMEKGQSPRKKKGKGERS